MWDMLNAMGFGAPGTYALRLTVTGPDNWDEAFTTLTVVPEPLSLSLVGIGLAALAVRRRRRRAWPAP